MSEEILETENAEEKKPQKDYNNGFYAGVGYEGTRYELNPEQLHTQPALKLGAKYENKGFYTGAEITGGTEYIQPKIEIGGKPVSTEHFELLTGITFGATFNNHTSTATKHVGGELLEKVPLDNNVLHFVKQSSRNGITTYTGPCGDANIYRSEQDLPPLDYKYRQIEGTADVTAKFNFGSEKNRTTIWSGVQLNLNKTINRELSYASTFKAGDKSTGTVNGYEYTAHLKENHTLVDTVGDNLPASVFVTGTVGISRRIGKRFEVSSLLTLSKQGIYNFGVTGTVNF